MTEIDVGTEDDLHVLRFHAKETTSGRSFRWTRDTSYVSLSTLPATSPRDHALDGRRRQTGPRCRVRSVTVSLQLGYEAGKRQSVERILGTA